MAYDADYYRRVYGAFADPVFARRWALACALSGGYAGLHWAAALEFGAGLGQNLAVVDAAEKWAVDVSEASRQACVAQGLEWRSGLDRVPDGHFDLLLSRHSLEHVDRPLDILVELRRKARPDGRLVVVVPIESLDLPPRLEAFDEHHHLYAWSPITLKNLCLAAGWRPVRLQRCSARGFLRMLPLAETHPGLFAALRRVADRWAGWRGGEIVIHCIPAIP